MPDRLYLKLMYRLRLGRRLNLDAPKTFTEKLQWLKLNNHRPEYSRMVDKCEMKAYVENILGFECTPKTLGVWDRVEAIEWEALPKRFVLKTTHDNAGVVICKDKDTFDRRKAEKMLERHLRRNFYEQTKEWPYKDVPPRVMAEEYLGSDDQDLLDYKFLCFEGEPQLFFVAGNRSEKKFFNYYDMDFNPLPLCSRYGVVSSAEMMRPSRWTEMVECAAKLSQGIPHLRVDFYCVDDRLYVGELTFFDSSGYDDMNSYEMDLKLGELIRVI